MNMYKGLFVSLILLLTIPAIHGAAAAPAAAASGAAAAVASNAAAQSFNYRVVSPPTRVFGYQEAWWYPEASEIKFKASPAESFDQIKTKLAQHFFGNSNQPIQMFSPVMEDEEAKKRRISINVERAKQKTLPPIQYEPSCLPDTSKPITTIDQLRQTKRVILFTDTMVEQYGAPKAKAKNDEKKAAKK